MLERSVMTMNGARTARELSSPSEDISESSDLLTNPSYDIITGDVGQFTTQYYHTVEPQDSTALSPKDGDGSSSDSSTSGRSKTSSTSSDEGGHHHHRHHGKMEKNSPTGIQGSLPSTLEYAVSSQQKGSTGVCGGSGGGSGSSDGSAVKHWSYEEQFKQLYNLSGEPERKEFLDKLFDYMQKKGSPITRVPIMAKQPLDLYRLFKLVVERGGLVEVIKKKSWRAVAKELNLPASITSAAFTMRSQYVKYLYPYECEIENLSDPQELQVAIDSHKRDRRQSDTVDFMHQPLTGVRNSLEHLTPVTNTITATQGLQILNSPTLALPHGAIPPYSGSFIVTGPGGTQMVTPQISGPPQLVQMTTPHGIPIMVPALAPGAKQDMVQSAADDRDDVSSQASSDMSERESAPPPAKRVALEGGRSIAAATRIPPGGFVMTPTRHMVPTSHFTSPGHHVVQMGPNSHIPIVMPTTTATSFISQTSPVEAQVSNNVIVKEDSTRRSPLENGLRSPHLVTGNSSSSAKRTQVISASHLFHMTQPPHMPLVIPTSAAVTIGRYGNTKHRASESSSNSDQTDHTPLVSSAHVLEKPHSKHNGGAGSLPGNPPTALKMPFANIAIQSANKDGESGDSTLLVTLEINDTVFQGVLFAKPNPTSSPSR